MSPGVTAEDGGATLLGKQVSDLQSGVAIGNGAITGTLYKNEGWSSGYLKGPGYYLALKFTSSDWSQYDSVKVGLDPSAQSGIVEILNDPDKNGVFKVKQNLSQKFVVEYRKGDAVERDVYDLSGLTLSEEPPTPPTPPADPGPIKAMSFGTFFTPTGQAKMVTGGNNIDMGTYEQVTKGGETIEQYTGVSGTITDTDNLGAFFFWAGDLPEGTNSVKVMMNEHLQALVPTGVAPICFALNITDFDPTGTVNGTITFYSDSYETEISTVNFAFVNANVTQA